MKKQCPNCHDDGLTCELCGTTTSSESKLIGLLAGFEPLFNALKEHITDGATHWSIEGFVDKPEGKKQESDCHLFKHEWVDQSSAYPCDDCYEGNMYFPLPDGRYLKVYFAC